MILSLSCWSKESHYEQRTLGLNLILVASLAGPTIAHVEQDAAAIANHYLAAMQRKGYAFLSKGELLRRRDLIAAFTVKHLRQPLDRITRVAILDGIDRCIDRLYTSPAGAVYYGNGFGSGSEEWMYLNDRDYFLTFQYHLWVGLTRQPLAPLTYNAVKRSRIGCGNISPIHRFGEFTKRRCARECATMRSARGRWPSWRRRSRQQDHLRWLWHSPER